MSSIITKAAVIGTVVTAFNQDIKLRKKFETRLK